MTMLSRLLGSGRPVPDWWNRPPIGPVSLSPPNESLGRGCANLTSWRLTAIDLAVRYADFDNRQQWDQLEHSIQRYCFLRTDLLDGADAVSDFRPEIADRLRTLAGQVVDRPVFDIEIGDRLADGQLVTSIQTRGNRRYLSTPDGRFRDMSWTKLDTLPVRR